MLDAFSRRRAAPSGTQRSYLSRPSCAPTPQDFRLLARRGLPNRGGDSLQVTDVAHPWDRTHIDLYPKSVHGQIHHGSLALTGKLTTAGKYPPSRGVQANQDGEQRVQEVQSSVLVDLKQGHPLKSRYRVQPGGKVAK